MLCTVASPSTLNKHQAALALCLDLGASFRRVTTQGSARQGVKVPKAQEQLQTLVAFIPDKECINTGH